MKTYPECMQCFVRQAVDASTLAGVSEDVYKEILDEVSKLLPKFSTDETPPEIAKHIYSIVESFSGHNDFYREVKKKSNDMALELYPPLRDKVASSEDPLLAAVRLAVAGNVIDYGVPHVFDIENEIEECLTKDFFFFDYAEFKEKIEKANNILYLLDNAGEIVFDKLLIETIGKDVVCAVREVPIINDVTLEDAKYVGLDKVAKVISSGSNLPGTVPGLCTDEFMEYFDNADVIVSKGQGNFETLNDVKSPIFFIFKAKCPVVSRFLGCTEGDILLKQQS